MDRYLVVARSKATDPEGARFRAAIQAHFACEKAMMVRDALIFLLAIFGAPLWLSAEWPALFPASLRAAILALWVLGFAAFLSACCVASLRLRARDRYASLDTHPPDSMRQ